MGYNSKFTSADVERKLEEVSALSRKVEALEQGGGGMRKLRMVVIGNSYSCDSFMYLPFILKEYGIEIELGVYYRGGGSLANHVSEWNSASNDFYYIDTHGMTSWTKPKSTNPYGAVTYKDWDIIVLQQDSVSSVNESSFEPSARNLIKLIDSVREKPYKLAWNININRAASGSNYAEIAQKVLNNIKKCVSKEPISLIFPYGTAIMLAREDETIGNIGDGGNLWCSDKIHLQEGLPCYIASLAIAESLFREFYPQFSVMGDMTRPTADKITAWSVKSVNGSSIGVTDDNCFLAQIYAVLANNNYWSASVETLPDIDVPRTDVEAIEIVGADSITDSGTYTINYTPSDTNQKAVTWSIAVGSAYASINQNGVVTALDGANNTSITIRATSNYNSSITATKTIIITKSVSEQPDQPSEPADSVAINFVDGTVNASGVLTSNSSYYSTDDYIKFEGDDMIFSLDTTVGIRLAYYDSEYNSLGRGGNLYTFNGDVSIYELYAASGMTKEKAPYFKITINQSNTNVSSINNRVGAGKITLIKNQNKKQLSGFFANKNVVNGFFSEGSNTWISRPSTTNVQAGQYLTFDSIAFADGEYQIVINSGYKVRPVLLYNHADVTQTGVQANVFKDANEFTGTITSSEIKELGSTDRTEWTLNVSSTTNGKVVLISEIEKALTITKIGGNDPETPPSDEPQQPIEGAYPINFVNGTLNSTTGILESFDTFASTDDFIPYDAGMKIINTAGLTYKLVLYDADKNYIKRASDSTFEGMLMIDLYRKKNVTAQEAPYFKLIVAGTEKLAGSEIQGYVNRGEFVITTGNITGFWLEHPLIGGTVQTASPYINPSYRLSYCTFETSIPFDEGDYEINFDEGWKFRWITTAHISPDDYSPASSCRRFGQEVTSPTSTSRTTVWSKSYANEGHTDWTLNITSIGSEDILIEDVMKAFRITKIS